MFLFGMKRGALLLISSRSKNICIDIRYPRLVDPKNDATSTRVGARVILQRKMAQWHGKVIRKNTPTTIPSCPYPDVRRRLADSKSQAAAQRSDA
jgi:hypothetical protein